MACSLPAVAAAPLRLVLLLRAGMVRLRAGVQALSRLAKLPHSQLELRSSRLPSRSGRPPRPPSPQAGSFSSAE